MSAIIFRSIVKRGRTNIVRMLRLNASHQCWPIISASRHIHLNSQPKKSNSATFETGENSDSSSVQSTPLPISTRIVACVKNNKYDEALDLLHTLQRDDKSAHPALKQTLLQLSNVKHESTSSSLFMAEFWDVCVGKDVGAKMATAFALSFEYADDIKRMQQLANHITQKSPTGPKWISAFSLVSYVLARHDIADKPFQRCAARFLNYVPSYTMPMLCHQGAVFSLFRKKQVDEAVDYLKSHAAGLQISNDSWNLVMTTLHDAGRSAEIVRLYEFWMSVLPPIDELKQRANYEQIVPNAVTYDRLLDCESITPKFMLSQLDVFGLSSDAELHNKCICIATKNGDHETAMRAWGDLRKRGFAMSRKTMSALTDIIRFHAEKPEHLAAADVLAVLVWDKYGQRGARAYFSMDWYAPYMSAFRRLDNSKRTLEFMERLKSVSRGSIRQLQNEGVVSDVLRMLTKHNQTDEYEALLKLLPIK